MSRSGMLGTAVVGLALLVLPAPAADISIIGTWEFVAAVPAPWSKPENAAALQAEGNHMLKTEVTFAQGR